MGEELESTDIIISGPVQTETKTNGSYSEPLQLKSSIKPPPDGTTSSEKPDYVYPLKTTTEDSFKETVEPHLTFYGQLLNTLMDSSLKTKLEELWITLHKEETTEIEFSDTEETIPPLKFGLSNLSETELMFISEISKETNV